MTGVYGLGPLAPPRGGRARRAPDGFSVPDLPEPRPAETEATGAVGWAGMLALQEAEGDAVADREAKRHGQDILAELAAVQRDLLGRGIDRLRLARLAALTAQIPSAHDPGLRSVIAAVALRARVEMARWGGTAKPIRD